MPDPVRGSSGGSVPERSAALQVRALEAADAARRREAQRGAERAAQKAAEKQRQERARRAADAKVPRARRSQVSVGV
jgi:hypothetical protein